MTASSAPDLVSRVLAAIDETERIAREAADSDSGRWFVGWKWNVYRAEDEAPWDDVEENRLVVYGNMDVQSEHIALHDPASILRRCAADRKVVAEYKTTRQLRKEHPGDLGLAGAVLALRGVVKRLAEGYGITPEEH